MILKFLCHFLCSVIRTTDVYVSADDEGLNFPGCGILVSPCETLEYTVSHIAADGDVILLIAAPGSRTTDGGDVNQEDSYIRINDSISLSRSNLTIKAAVEFSARISIVSSLGKPIFTLASNLTPNDNVSLTFDMIRFSNLTLLDLPIKDRTRRRNIAVLFKRCELLNGFKILANKIYEPNEMHNISTNVTLFEGEDTSNTTILNVTPESSRDISNKTQHNSSSSNVTLPPEGGKDLSTKTIHNETSNVGKDLSNKTINNGFPNATLSAENKDISNNKIALNNNESANVTLLPKSKNIPNKTIANQLNIEISDSLIKSTFHIDDSQRTKVNLTILNSDHSAGFISSLNNSIEFLHVENVTFTGLYTARQYGSIIYLNGKTSTKTLLVLNNVTVTGSFRKKTFLWCEHCCIESTLLTFRDLSINSGIFLFSVDAFFSKIELKRVNSAWTFVNISNNSMVNLTDIFSIQHSSFSSGPIFSVNLSSVVRLKKLQGTLLVIVTGFI